MDSDRDKKIAELQLFESQLQNFLMQKQTMQAELNEIEDALGELKKSGDDVYRITSGVMFKSDKKNLIKELEVKKKNIEMRISAIEKQENLLESKSKELRKEVKTQITDGNEK